MDVFAGDTCSLQSRLKTPWMDQSAEIIDWASSALQDIWKSVLSPILSGRGRCRARLVCKRWQSSVGFGTIRIDPYSSFLAVSLDPEATQLEAEELARLRDCADRITCSSPRKIPLLFSFPKVAQIVVRSSATPYSSSALDEQDLAANSRALVLGISGALSLTELVLDQCHLNAAVVCAVAEVLQWNTTLRLLDLSRNVLGNDGAIALAKVLEVNSTLQKLVLNDVIMGSRGASSIFDSVGRNSTLTSLDVSKSILDESCLRSLASAMSSNRSLAYLDISSTSVGAGFDLLADSLKENKNLRWLALSHGGISVSTIVQRLRPLRSLLLHSCMFCEDALLSLCDAIASTTTLVRLSISHSYWADHLFDLLAKAIGTSKSLKSVSLDSNFGTRGTPSISFSRLIETNSSIESLRIRHSMDGSDPAATECVSAFALTLTRNSTLQRLKFEQNSLTLLQATLLGSALQCATVKIASFAWNRIGDGVVSFEDVIMKGSLTQLDLRGGFCGPMLGSRIAAALSHNETITKINLSSNSMEDEGLAALCESLKVNKTLLRCNFDGNKVTGSALPAVLAALKVNCTLVSLSLRWLALSNHTELKAIANHFDRARLYAEVILE